MFNLYFESPKANARMRLLLAACCSTVVVSCTNPTTVAESALANKSASGIDLSAIDTAVRAQDDFHNYANGVWLREKEIPEEYGRYGAFTELSEDAERKLKTIINDSAEGKLEGDNPVAQKIGDLYASFMDEEAIEARGIAGIKADLARVAAMQNSDDLQAGIADLMKTGFRTPYDIGVFADFKDSSKTALYFFQAGLGLPDRDYYLVKDNERFVTTLADYRAYIADLLQMAAIIAEPDAAEKMADKIIALETKIAEAQWSSTQNRVFKDLYNPKEIADLQEITNKLSWKSSLERMGVAELPYVVVAQPSYFTELGELLTEEPIEVWKRYLQAAIVSDASPYLSKEFVDRRFEFYGKTLSGLEKQKERWRRGVRTVNSTLGEALGQLYVARHFPPEAKQKMLGMVDRLLQEFAIGIDNLDWMSEATKKEAQNKLGKFTVKIGYPDEWRDYSALEIDASTLVENMRRARLFEYEYTIAKLDKPVNKKEWGMTPQTVNAYYNPTLNEIVFPAAILQPPFFDLNADDALNYGGAGMVIGHEISHGFDDQGSTFDGDGTLRNWWTDEDRAQFKAATDKLVAQYAEFEPIPGQKINGELTLGENIGDLSGAAVALKAYQRSLGDEAAPVLDGFTGTQRFFMSLARIWRQKSRDESMQQRLVSDPHSPARYRVNGVVQNLDEFYEAFDVKPGDKHYLPPDERVKIW